jgi:hypothetical protein
MTPTTHRAVRDYLAAVERALADLPRERREGIVADLREHVDAALAEAGDAGEAYVRTVLDRLGSPADIAAEARERFGVTGPPRRHVKERVALLLTTLGSVVVPVLGWGAGMVLVWGSSAWRTWHKVLATLLFPLGTYPAFFVLTHPARVTAKCFTDTAGSFAPCPPVQSRPVAGAFAAYAVLFLSAVGPFVSAVVLARALPRRGAR